MNKIYHKISCLVFDFTYSSLFVPFLYVSEYIKNIVRTSRKFFYFLMNPSVYILALISQLICSIFIFFIKFHLKSAI